MAEVVWFYQERMDDGQRIGITDESNTLIQAFIEGSENIDPALTWYVDVRFETPESPTESNVRVWLRRHAGEIRTALRSAAEIQKNGVDPDGIPWHCLAEGSEGPVRVSVAAIRRLAGRPVAEKLEWLASQDLQAFFDCLSSSSRVA